MLFFAFSPKKGISPGSHDQHEEGKSQCLRAMSHFTLSSHLWILTSLPNM